MEVRCRVDFRHEVTKGTRRKSKAPSGDAGMTRWKRWHWFEIDWCLLDSGGGCSNVAIFRGRGGIARVIYLTKVGEL